MNNQKFCNFYVNNNHLLTVLMPYINEKIKEQKEFIIFSQKDVSSDVKRYLKKVKIFEGETEKILSMGWKKYKNELNQAILNKDIAIVIGDEEFIDKINMSIDEENKFYEVINCYNIEKVKDIAKIYNQYTWILNTTGKFETKNSHNAQKRKTIKSQ